MISVITAAWILYKVREPVYRRESLEITINSLLKDFEKEVVLPVAEESGYRSTTKFVLGSPDVSIRRIVDLSKNGKRIIVHIVPGNVSVEYPVTETESIWYTERDIDLRNPKASLRAAIKEYEEIIYPKVESGYYKESIPKKLNLATNSEIAS